ncbi:MAG TPA: hypothetical protein VFA21_21810 [Pyrinomonadaceae bacterium]|nr:hypothetical protein [Pyrinomonadaceae bacterium]
MPNSTFRKIADLFVVAFFVVAISSPLTVLLARGEGEPAWENRRLADLPQRPTNLSEAFHLPRMLAEYFKDHFGLRAEMIRWQALVKVNWLKSSSSPDIIIGKDGCLFYAGEGGVELYSRTKPFTDDELSAWRSYLESVRDAAKGFGASFVFVVAPEKQTIYPELMPDKLVRLPNASRLDQLVEYLKGHADIRVVDVRPALFDSKHSRRAYFLTDTHWSGAGAFAAYQTIVRELGKEFGGMQPLAASDCAASITSTKGGDLAGMLGLYDVLTEDKYIMVPKRPRAQLARNCFDRGRCTSRVEGASLPRLYMQRDSFSSYLIPLLAEHFSEGLYVWDVRPGWHPDLIEAARPNVVLLEMSERSLLLPPPEGPQSTGGH